MKSSSRGFTLVELAIVLVIIGLIIAGVLVGRDMISAASVRATIGQVEKFNATVNVFRSKFGGIPGDLPATKASQYGFFANGMDGSFGKGDGNGLLQDATGILTVPRQINEPLVFWRHLSDALMINATLGASMAVNGVANPDAACATAPSWFPISKMKGSAYFVVYSYNSYNWYQLVTCHNTAANNAGGADDDPAITPLEAFSMDTKMDDGVPLTGKVLAEGGNQNFGALSAPGDGCTVAGAPATYDTATTNANQVKCTLSFQFQ